MRARFKPDSAPDPFAVRTLDIAPDGQELLIGRHSSTGEHRLAIAAPHSLAWKEDLSWALEGAAVFARFLYGNDAILFQDERGAVWVVSRQSRQIDCVHPGAAGYISVSHGRQIVAICGATIELFRFPEKAAKEWQIEKPGVIAAINAPGSQLALAGDGIAGVELHDIATRRLLARLAKTLEAAHALEFNSTGRYLVLIGGGMRGCTVWDLEQHMRAGEIFCNPGQNNNFCLDFHPRLPFIAFGTFAGYVVLVNLVGNAIAYMERLHDGQIWDVKFSHDGSHLFSAGDDGALWRIEWSEMIFLGTTRVG